MEDGLIQDAAIAESLAQSKAFWHLRESIPLAQVSPGTRATVSVAHAQGGDMGVRSVRPAPP